MNKQLTTKPKKVNPYIVAITILLPAFMSMVASSATNVCQPHIAGYFGATPYEANSIITAYIISGGIMLPIFGWWLNTSGKKSVACWSVSLFCLGCILCLLCKDLHMLILCRIVQGAAGGALLPLAQAVLLDTFPPEKKGVAMGFFGFAAMFSPLFGPFVGGYLTDNYSWKWVFIMNIPICLISLLLIKFFINSEKTLNAPKRKMDYVGLLSIILAMGCMQIVLDKGEQFNWFDTYWIYWLTLISVVSFVFFYVWELETKKPIVDVRVFKDRNFLIGTFISSFINIMLYGTLLLIPMFGQNMLGYSPYFAGVSVFPRAVSCFLGLLIMGRIADKVENRLLTVIGLIIMSISVFMFSRLNTTASIESIILPNIILGIGIAVTFVPVSALSFITLSKTKLADAAGLHALFKNIVTAVSTSAVSTFVTRVSQIHQNYLVAYLSPTNLNFQYKIIILKSKFLTYFAPYLAAKKASGYLYKQMLLQSKLCAFYDVFLLLSLMCILAIPFILLFKMPKKRKIITTIRAYYRIFKHRGVI